MKRQPLSCARTRLDTGARLDYKQATSSVLMTLVCFCWLKRSCLQFAVRDTQEQTPYSQEIWVPVSLSALTGLVTGGKNLPLSLTFFHCKMRERMSVLLTSQGSGENKNKDLMKMLPKFLRVL